MQSPRFIRRLLPAAVAVVAGAVLITVFVPGSSEDWKTYRDAGDLWTLRYPSPWHIQPFGQDPGDFRGVLVSNVAFLFQHPHPKKGYTTTAWDMRGLPRDAVVVQVQFGDFGPVGPYGPPWSHFPLNLAAAKPVTDHPAFGAPQPRLFLPLNVPDQPHDYSVFVWFGRYASHPDQQTAALIVASLRFALPRVALGPSQGPVGSTVIVRGSGFQGDWRDIALRGSFGITLLRVGPDGCDPTIGAQFEAVTRARLHVDGVGTLTGSFTVPDRGHCTAERAGSPAHPPLRPGLYSARIGCYQCDLASFRVTTP